MTPLLAASVVLASIIGGLVCVVLWAMQSPSPGKMRHLPRGSPPPWLWTPEQHRAFKATGKVSQPGDPQWSAATAAKIARKSAAAEARQVEQDRKRDHARILILERISYLRTARGKAVNRWGDLDTAAWGRTKSAFIQEVLRRRTPAFSGISISEASILIDEVLTRTAGDPADPNGIMTPVEFEQHCADRLAAAGWTVQTTKASGDQGADVVASKLGRRAVLQCKLYSRPVGNGAVQEAAAARDYYQADTAAVVTNAGFTSAAQDLARATRVLLLHPEQLATL